MLERLNQSRRRLTRGGEVRSDSISQSVNHHYFYSGPRDRAEITVCMQWSGGGVGEVRLCVWLYAGVGSHLNPGRLS